MSDDNLRVWRHAFDPPKDALKRVNMRGGFTSIDAYWLIHKATELWGPMGDKWGYDKPALDFVSVPGHIVCQMTLFYPGDEDQGSVYVADMIALGERIDEDAPKKVITGCISKALSYLGFGGSVFLGMHEGKYKDQQEKPEAPKRESKPASKPAAASKPTPAGLISDAQCKRLWAIWRGRTKELEMPAESDTDAALREILGRHGFEHTTEITRQAYDAICKEAAEYAPF